MMNEFFNFTPDLLAKADEAEKLCREQFIAIDKIAEYNMRKVLAAFIKNKVSSHHLTGTNGYGYDDSGRDNLDRVFASVFGTEDALVRHGFISGTHAISTALFGVLRPRDTLVSLTGAPYDTLKNVFNGESGGSLKEFGINIKEIGILEDGAPDLKTISEAVKGVKAVYIQRSRGYSLRPSLSVNAVNGLIKTVRSVNPSAITITDNCYGEFCEENEPCADLLIGSLIKNPGGGIAETGGYIAGRSDLISLCAQRLTTVGIGKEAGCSLNQNRNLYLGLYHAPGAVAGALKTSVFCSALLHLLGYKTYPEFYEPRTDIIAAFLLGGKKELIAFCKGIQGGSAIDSHVTPEPWAMPGYGSEIIMAAGAFTMGASIELSADAPIREPYAVYVQGGLNYPAGKTGILSAVNELIKYKNN